MRQPCEFDDDISVERDIVEDEVGIEVLLSHLEMLLLSDESEAVAHFEQILRYVRHKLPLNVSLIHRFCLPHQIEDVRGFHQIVGKIALWLWQESGEVVDFLCRDLPCKEVGVQLHL